jgi:hypothetical protein
MTSRSWVFFGARHRYASPARSHVTSLHITTRSVSEGSGTRKIPGGKHGSRLHESHHNPKRQRGIRSTKPPPIRRSIPRGTRQSHLPRVGTRNGVSASMTSCCVSPSLTLRVVKHRAENADSDCMSPTTTRSVSEGSRVRKSQRYSGLSGQDTRPAHLPRVGARDCAPSSTTPCLVDPSRTLRVVKKPRKIRSSTVIDSKNATSKTKRLEFINNQ